MGTQAIRAHHYLGIIGEHMCIYSSISQASLGCDADHTPCAPCFQAVRPLFSITNAYTPWASYRGSGCVSRAHGRALCRAGRMKHVDNFWERVPPSHEISSLGEHDPSMQMCQVFSTGLWRVRGDCGELNRVLSDEQCATRHSALVTFGSGKSIGGSSARFARPNWRRNSGVV